jgi:hypothetical protein
MSQREIALEIVPYFHFEGQDKYKQVVQDLIDNVFIPSAWETAVLHTITPYFSRRAPSPPTLWLLLLTPLSQKKAPWKQQQTKLLAGVQQRQGNAEVVFIIPRLETEEWLDVPDKDTLMTIPPYVVIDIKQSGQNRKAVQFDAEGTHSKHAVNMIRKRLKMIVPELPNIAQVLEGGIRVLDLSSSSQDEDWWTTNKVVGIVIFGLLVAIILGFIFKKAFFPRRRRRR